MPLNLTKTAITVKPEHKNREAEMRMRGRPPEKLRDGQRRPRQGQPFLAPYAYA